MKRDEPAEAGFVLPSVLAILVVITVAAVLATQQLQTRTRTSTVRLDGLRLQGLADGVARFLAVSLVNERSRRLRGLSLPEDGTPITCPLPGGGTIQVAVQDQAGLIDLNASPRPLLEDAFRALGLPDTEASTIAAEIVDDRDEDDNPEPSGGAEAPQYKARGLPYGPRNAPFGTTDELERLPSMNAVTAAILEPAVTVWNAGGGIDPNLNRTLMSRSGAAGDGLRKYAKSTQHQFFEIRVVAEDRFRARAGRIAILSADARSTGLGLIAWRPSTALISASLQHPACDQIVLVVKG